MSYDPYSDPQNPVTKSKRFDLGSGNGGGDFMYGSGGRTISNTMPSDDDVVGGYTEAQEAYINDYSSTMKETDG